MYTSNHYKTDPCATGRIKRGGIHTNYSHIIGTILSVNTTRSTSLKLDTDIDNSKANCPPTIPRISLSCSHSRVQENADTFIGIQVDRKINLLVEELCQFEMSITGIKEMKWFGQDVYENGFLLVHPFWQVNLADGEPVQNPSRHSSNRAHRRNKQMQIPAAKLSQEW